jgi:hypothetical protein
MPWDARRLTPVELYELWKGHQWRWRQQIGALAYLFCGLMNRIPLHEKGVKLDEVLEVVERWWPREPEE